MPSPSTGITDPAVLMRCCRDAIATVLKAPDARRIHGAPFSPTERRFLQLVALPVLEQLLDRLQLIRVSQEQEQWNRFAAAPPRWPHHTGES